MPTPTVNAVLSAGFAEANRKFSLIFIDLFWKIAWLAGVGMMTLLAVSWFFTELNSIQWSGTGSQSQNPLLVLALVRELWNAYAGTFLVIAITGVLLSSTAWMMMEAYFRAGILPAERTTFIARASRHFKTFLAASLLKLLIVAGAGTLLSAIVLAPFMSSPFSEWSMLWPEARGAVVVALAILIAVWFAAMVLETLLRNDAMELLGPNLGLLAGTIGILVIFEGMLALSFLIGIVSLLQLVYSGAGVVLVAMLTLAGMAVCSVLHSYLLIVRFSAVGIMRHDGDI